MWIAIVAEKILHGSSSTAVQGGVDKLCFFLSMLTQLFLSLIKRVHFKWEIKDGLYFHLLKKVPLHFLYRLLSQIVFHVGQRRMFDVPCLTSICQSIPALTEKNTRSLRIVDDLISEKRQQQQIGFNAWVRRVYAQLFPNGICVIATF